MTHTMNELGQPIGYAIHNFKPPSQPNFHHLYGNFVSVEPISESHLSALYESFSLDLKGGNWTYLAYGPFQSSKEFSEWAQKNCFGEDPKFYTILLGEKPAGLVSYLRIEPLVGCLEVGHVHLSPLLQKKREGTEALILMIQWAFNAGYRRVEWKCDALNAPSRHAAQRLGFSFEGIFRQATIYKSRNRDTAWHSITHQEWPALENAFQIWRNPKNFDSEGKELQKLSNLTSRILTHNPILQN